MDSIYIGCDLHKRTSNLCVKTKDGVVLWAAKIKTTATEFRSALRKYRGAHIVFEPVSQSWWLGDLLEDMGFVISLANAREVKAIAHARVKNDRIDATVLCDLLRGGLLPESYRSTKAARAYKEAVRFRASLVGMRTQVKNKIHALLGRRGIVPRIGMIFGPVGLKWLAQVSLPALDRQHLDEYLSLLAVYEEKIATASARVRALATESNEASLLTSIPGVSYVTALTILSEIDTVSRFANGKQVASYAGLVPRVYGSGEKVRYGRLTKSGSPHLRTILIEAAHRQGRLKKQVGLRPYFERVAARKGTRTATVATARKLCVVMYHILSSQEPFDDTRMVARLQT